MFRGQEWTSHLEFLGNQAIRQKCLKMLCLLLPFYFSPDIFSQKWYFCQVILTLTCLHWRKLSKPNQRWLVDFENTHQGSSCHCFSWVLENLLGHVPLQTPPPTHTHVRTFSYATKGIVIISKNWCWWCLQGVPKYLTVKVSNLSASHLVHKIVW